MKEFDELLNVIDRLLGPNGCPWDREQTLMCLRSSVLEEVCELIEAIDLGENHQITEELGDLLFNAVFLCRIAEKEKCTSLNLVLKEVSDKLIRRHPHVFGDAIAENTAEVLIQWEQIKKNEKGKEHRKSLLDDIPKNLPALMLAQKSLKKMSKVHYSKIPAKSTSMQFEDEESLGNLLLEVVAVAQQKGIDAEQSLRKRLADLEKDFRVYEASSE